MRPALLLLALASGCSLEGHFERPEWSLLRMLEQPRADAYEPVPESSGEPVLRQLPDGIVATSTELGPPEVVEGKTSTGDYVRTIPIATSIELLAEGRRHFRVVCATCHGRLGDGGSMVARYMQVKKPASFHTDAHRALPPGRLFEIVTKGSGLMPSYAVELDVHSRWAVVAFVKALELSQHAEVASLPDGVRTELEREATP